MLNCENVTVSQLLQSVLVVNGCDTTWIMRVEGLVIGLNGARNRSNPMVYSCTGTNE